MPRGNRPTSPCSRRGDLLWCRRSSRGGLIVDFAGRYRGSLSRPSARLSLRSACRPAGARARSIRRPAAGHSAQAAPGRQRAATAAGSAAGVQPIGRSERRRRQAEPPLSRDGSEQPFIPRLARLELSLTSPEHSDAPFRLSRRRAARRGGRSRRRSPTRSARRSIAIRPRRWSAITACSPTPSPTCRRSSATP